MTLRLELWVEGPTDALTHARFKDADEGKAPAHTARGALIPLVKKALSASIDITPKNLNDRLPNDQISAHMLTRKVRDPVAFKDDRRQYPISNKARKLLIAMSNTRRNLPNTMVLAIWDRDGKVENERDRDGILKILREHGKEGTAVALCVEELEAWLLGDPGAFRRCFKKGPKKGLPGAPENLPNPKEKLVEILNELGVSGDDWAGVYHDLAEQADVETLAKNCPRGFDEMRKALVEFLAPCVLSAAGSTQP
ncbi:MAG: DUF4276 family protein [Polyangiaceae bacterium]|nr:DUF4276 family protein [Polyangiaceae bacterium]